MLSIMWSLAEAKDPVQLVSKSVQMLHAKSFFIVHPPMVLVGVKCPEAQASGGKVTKERVAGGMMRS